MKYIKLFEAYNGTPKEFMSDLYDVGIKKAVGYLPYDNIRIYGKDTVENVIKWCKKHNLEYIHLKGNVGSGGAFYVYDYNMLKNMLEKYADILINAHIPLEPHAYIKFIDKYTILQNVYPEAYRVIGLTFNDKRFRE